MENTLTDKEIETLSNFQNGLCYVGGKISVIKQISKLRGFDAWTSEHTHFISLLQYMSVEPDESRALLRFYANASDAERNRRTVGKPAKMLGKIIPDATEKQKEQFAVWWKETIQIDASQIKILSSKEPEDFARVYTMAQAFASDPRLNHDRKSLAASCMRYKFEELPYHPAYIYGSGDFEIVWAENAKGELMGRYVASIRGGRYVRGPIYTNTDVAAELLEIHAAECFVSCEDKEKTTWLNSRLLRVPVYEDGFLAPYFDRDAGAYDNGQYLIVSKKNAEFNLTETQGFVGGFEYACCECGCGLNEYNIYMPENGDGVFCESCFMDNFSYCPACEQHEPSGSFVEIRGGECVCEWCANNSDAFVQCSDSPRFEPEHAHIDDVVITECGLAFHIDDEDKYFFRSDVDDEYYPIDDEAQLPVWFADRMTVEQAIESGHWTKYIRANGETAFKLKIYLEFRGGEIVNRQGELPFAA